MSDEKAKLKIPVELALFVISISTIGPLKGFYVVTCIAIICNLPL